MTTAKVELRSAIMTNQWIIFEYGSTRIYIAPVPDVGANELRPDKTAGMIVEQAIRKAIGLDTSSEGAKSK